MTKMTRREFITTGAKLVALASVPAILPISPARLLATPNEADLATYLDLFEVDEAVIKKIIGVALEKGGDYCDLYFEHKISNWVGLQDDAVNRIAEIAFKVNETTENIGARRLHTIMERLLDVISYEAPDRSGDAIDLDADYVDQHLDELAGNEDLSRYIL